MLLGFTLPHGEFLVIGLFIGVAGVALITIARFWPETKPVVTAVAPVETTSLVPGTAPQLTGPVVAFARTIAWPSHIDPDAGTLTRDERRVVIDGLATVGDAWCARILADAYVEEDDELRIDVIEALARCESDLVLPVLERAYSSHVVAERYAAIDGASRRADVALLERALRDTDGTVALAAAYGLHRARRDDITDSALASRDDARAAEIRRMMPILAASD